MRQDNLYPARGILLGVALGLLLWIIFILVTRDTPPAEDCIPIGAKTWIMLCK